MTIRWSSWTLANTRKRISGNAITVSVMRAVDTRAQASTPLDVLVGRAGHAVAWNPSLPGGAKSEDTYLVSAGGACERLTTSPGWPAEPDDAMQPPRPAVLEVGQ